MDKMKFFYDNKDKFEEIANFLANKEGENRTFEEIFNHLESDFKNEIKTNHEEKICIKGGKLDIKSFICNNRNEKNEHYYIFAIQNEGFYPIYHSIGGLTSSQADLYEVANNLVQSLSNIKLPAYIYVFHNHPYVHRAVPSEGDVLLFEDIVKKIDIINNSMNKHILHIVDFGVCTMFDYWSFKEENFPDLEILP